MGREDIRVNLNAVHKRIIDACSRVGRSPNEVTLIAATKAQDPAIIEAAFNLGISHFGENRVQEAEQKIKVLSHLQPGPTWHMIGHLQSNKVKPALKLFDVIQSVDSIELASYINKYSLHEKSILLQVNISGEKTKSGFLMNEIEFAFKAISKLTILKIKGLMTIAPLLNNVEQVRRVFRELHELGDYFGLEHLSMGMSDDFEIAIEEGSTMVRIGRAIFGERS